MPSGPSARASAPGKVILFGEHAVVYGEASLSLAINRRIHVDGELGGSLVTVNAEPLDIQHHAYIARAAELYWRGGPLRLRTQSDLPGAAGIGSSAALSVATVATLARLAGEPTDAATIAERAFHTEFETQGAASPNDTTVSTAGGAVLLGPRRLDSPDLEYLWEIRRGERAWTAHRAQLPPLPLVVATTGQRGRTTEQVAKVRRFVERNAFGRDVIREIGRLTLDGVQALRSNDLARVGQLMNRNHELLHILGVDTPELAHLVKAARRVPGTYGAKLTGAGGGGSIIALAENPDDVHAELVRAGAKAFLVEAEARGVLLEA